MLLVLATLLSPIAAAAELPESLQAPVDGAVRAGLPGDKLQAQALGGLAENVPEPRIASVLAELLGSWEQAAVVLGPRADEPDRVDVVPAAAAALKQGVLPDTIRELSVRDNAPVALWALADVVYAGVPVEGAAPLVLAALDSGQPVVALRELPEAARLLVAQGGSESVVSQISRTLTNGGTPLAAVPSDKGGPPGHSNAGGNDKSKGKGKSW